jgi:hypothetical protein
MASHILAAPPHLALQTRAPCAIIRPPRHHYGYRRILYSIRRLLFKTSTRFLQIAPWLSASARCMPPFPPKLPATASCSAPSPTSPYHLRLKSSTSTRFLPTRTPPSFRRTTALASVGTTSNITHRACEAHDDVAFLIYDCISCCAQHYVDFCFSLFRFRFFADE